MLSKKDLRIGNMFEQGIVCKINGRSGAKVHLYGKMKYDKRIRVINSVAVEDLKPIRLTPEILVDWCNGLKIGGMESFDAYKIGDMVVRYYFGTKSFLINLGQYNKEIRYLHQLQNTFSTLEDQELDIKG